MINILVSLAHPSTKFLWEILDVRSCVHTIIHHYAVGSAVKPRGALSEIVAARERHLTSTCSSFSSEYIMCSFIAAHSTAACVGTLYGDSV